MTFNQKGLSRIAKVGVVALILIFLSPAVLANASNGSAPFSIGISPIFSDNFESGNTTKWSRTVGSFYADPTAALAGSNYGGLVVVSNRQTRFVETLTPTGEHRYIANFHLNINNLKMGAKNKFTLLEGIKGTMKVFSLQVRKYNNKYWIRGIARLDGGNNLRTKWTQIASWAMGIKVDWKAGDHKTLHTGFLKLYINNVLKTSRTGLDNDTFTVETAQLGVTDPIKGAYKILGKFFVDNFVSEGTDEVEANCHPSYPTVCIPPPPPDLNCPDIKYTNFKVLPPDPHGFDRDKDGIGCETK